MARLSANDAIVSDNGEWYYTGFHWEPLVQMPTAPKPRMFSDDYRTAARLARERAGTRFGQQGEQLVQAIQTQGSLEAAEAALGALLGHPAAMEEALAMPPNYGLRSEDGHWWWDGSQWLPVLPT